MILPEPVEWVEVVRALLLLSVSSTTCRLGVRRLVQLDTVQRQILTTPTFHHVKATRPTELDKRSELIYASLFTTNGSTTS